MSMNQCLAGIKKSSNHAAPTLILDELSKRLGIAKLLEATIPEYATQILTMA